MLLKMVLKSVREKPEQAFDELRNCATGMIGEIINNHK